MLFVKAENYFLMLLKAIFPSKSTQGTGIKILPPKRML